MVDYDDVRKQGGDSAELAIRTHYEGLDIAGSNRIHYLSFQLPDVSPDKETDAILKAWVDEQPD